MREVEISKHVYKRIRNTKLLNQPILFFLYSTAVVSLFIAFLTRNMYIITGFFTILSFILNYHTNHYTLRLDIGQEVFLSLLLTRQYGLAFGMTILLVGELIPDIVTARLDKDTSVSLILSILINLIYPFLSAWNFIVVGMALVTAKFILSLVIDFMLESDPEEIVFETALNYLINMVLFIGFGNFFLGLLS